MSRKSSRRDFLKETALTGLGFWVAGGVSRAAPKSANEKLNVAIIGAGGQGGGNLRNIDGLGENIVALCDVDENRAAGAFKQFEKAKKYNDFRKMLEEMRTSIDAVVVSTPDHTHAPASVMAMKLGKHVYCEKPLTHDVYEARVMRETAAKQKVATQMGTQGTASDGLRRAVEIVQAGVIGPVKEVHVWTNRPGNYWKQGIPRPQETPEVPKHLHWDLWLGPAPERPYHPIYVPFAWRGWWDFGTGALGDMGCHTANMAYMALKLGAPKMVEAESAKFTPGESYPTWAVVTYQFPARGELPPVKLIWYEGNRDGKQVLPPQDLFHGQRVPSSGSLLIGEKGILFSPDDYGARFVLLPEKQFQGVELPKGTLPRSPGHHREWINACKGGPPAMSNFDYAGRLTEFILLGNVAIGVGQKIEWDAENLKATNCPEAERFIRRPYRKGWEL